MSKQEIRTYSSTGVNYELIDPLKRYAQEKASATSPNLERFGMSVIEASRGESAFVWEEEDSYKAFVIEGLGTKNLVADEVRRFSGKTHYDSLAKDTVAMVVNDLIVVGADPQVVNAYFAVSDSSWFLDEKRQKELVDGWTKACNEAGAVYGGGETPALSGIIKEGAIDLAGSAIGIIKPKERLTLGEKLTPGDTILVIESSGIHANGLSLARRIAKDLPQGYKTLLSDGNSYGESLLIPTHIYAGLVRDLFEAGVDIHYMVNITGHGWRKLMRANKEFSYIIDRVPKPQPVFEFIQEQSGNSDTEMYGNFNMGAGFAIFMPEDYISQAQRIAKEKYGFESEATGIVSDGQKRVLINPANIEFLGRRLQVR